MMHLLTITFLVGTAIAQEPEAKDEPQETEQPREAVEPGRFLEGQPSERPLAIPGPDAPREAPGAAAPAPSMLSADKLKALRAYKNRRLDLREEIELHGGGYHLVGGWGYPYGRWGWYESTVVVPEPVQSMRTWGVYRGMERLDTLEFLDVAGQDDLHRDLSHDIRRAKNASTAWFTVGGLGFAGVVGGIVALNTADQRYEAYIANQIILGSTVAAAVGMLAGSFPRSKANRLRRYPSATIPPDRAQQMVDDHNDLLRNELGLSPEDVWSIEAD